MVTGVFSSPSRRPPWSSTGSDRRDDPVGDHLTSEAEDPVASFFEVLADHRGQQAGCLLDGGAQLEAVETG
jgi:hypothetical protein